MTANSILVSLFTFKCLVRCLCRVKTELLSLLRVRIHLLHQNSSLSLADYIFLFSFSQSVHFLPHFRGHDLLSITQFETRVFSVSSQPERREEERWVLCLALALFCDWWNLTMVSSTLSGDAAPRSQVENPAAPPLVGEDAELVEQLRKVSLTQKWCFRSTWDSLVWLWNVECYGCCEGQNTDLGFRSSFCWWFKRRSSETSGISVCPEYRSTSQGVTAHRLGSSSDRRCGAVSSCQSRETTFSAQHPCALPCCGECCTWALIHLIRISHGDK